jgi:hypothetical protein
MEAEGWYLDPYELHGERWYSNGTATALVRDSHVESHDPPPAYPPAHDTLVRAEAVSTSDGSRDLRRADDAEANDGDLNYGDAAFDTFGYTQTVWDPLLRRDRRE